MEVAPIAYLQAKLEQIHEDVKQLRAHVDSLRQEAAGRSAVSKFVIVALMTIGATVGWLVDNAVTVSQKIEISARIKEKSDDTASHGNINSSARKSSRSSRD